MESREAEMVARKATEPNRELGRYVRVTEILEGYSQHH